MSRSRQHYFGSIICGVFHHILHPDTFMRSLKHTKYRSYKWILKQVHNTARSLRPRLQPVLFPTFTHSFGNCLSCKYDPGFLHQHPKWVSPKAGNTSFFTATVVLGRAGARNLRRGACNSLCESLARKTLMSTSTTTTTTTTTTTARMAKAWYNKDASFATVIYPIWWEAYREARS